MAVFDEHDAIFVHVPKTGGVAVSSALFGQDTIGGHRPARIYRLIYGAKCYEEMFTFGFVRDPIDRLISAYSYLKAGGRHHSSDRESAEALAGVGSLDDFVREQLGVGALASMAHFRPQSDLVSTVASRSAST